MIHSKYVIVGKILGTDVIIICFFNPLCIFTCILTVVLSYMVSLSCTYMHTASQYHSTLLSCNIYEYWSNFTLVHYWFFTGFWKLSLNLFISRFFARFHWFFNLSWPTRPEDLCLKNQWTSTLLVFWETPIDTSTYWYFNQNTSRFLKCTGTYWYLQAQSFACGDIRRNHYQWFTINMLS